MKKTIFLVLAVFALLLVSVMPGYAGGHFRGSVWIGPGWWGPPLYPYYYPPYPYYSEPPVVIERRSPVYIQPSQQQPEEQSYWYFCTKPEGYYPYVKRCPVGWLKVVPPSAPPDLGTRSNGALIPPNRKTSDQQDQGR